MGTITKQQLIAVQTHFKGLDRETRLDRLSAFFSRDVSSASSLSFTEAQEFLRAVQNQKLQDPKRKRQVRNVLSKCHELGWVLEEDPTKVDFPRLENWLLSFRSPVRKKLNHMEPPELSKIINALSAQIKKKYERS
ncbi:MAG: hypothetical protein C4K58_06830 [Flavobacteriaceae bacterium]|nr:MAG: hypothetical protein C4K58_06830 [Flavobacteriaceae bacterium]